jgi:hypothetical protein
VDDRVDGDAVVLGVACMTKPFMLSTSLRYVVDHVDGGNQMPLGVYVAGDVLMSGMSCLGPFSIPVEVAW